MEGGFLVVLLAAFVAVAAAQTTTTTHVVGDRIGWIIPPGGDAAYRTWAATRTFRVGDVLVFNFTTNIHDVAEVNRASFDSCSGANPISMTTTGPARINLTTAGEHHYICTFSQHCALGQKLSINVLAATSATPAPQPATPPPAVAPQPPTMAAPAPAPRSARTHTVGDGLGWIVPPGGAAAYQTWARNINFGVGDTLVFNFGNGRHDVLEVTRAEFDSCTVSTTTTRPITSAPARVPITTSGDHYYICTFPQHCSLGQKLAINVGSGTASSPNSGGPSTPSPETAPPPPTSSAPLPEAAASLTMALFCIALVFLHN
ncbi:blue copper protein-like [Andrographis paniculata]|uniref:blue copper protein-like n=1 Tax=Andrographis paniculata TaxID=175694 RepID=UPI0021E8F94E|nr:blue copper protein-like [Andrographis paniculata]